MRVRALLIVNPRATSTTRLRRDVIASALASAVQLDVVETRYRGHATKLASDACTRGYDLILTLGGDGTVNETVNGMLGDPAAPPPIAGRLPALGTVPGGSANVFAGALGLPRDSVDAAGQILQALASGRTRTIGVGVADDRYFTFNAGFGFDAEVVRAVQGLRAHGRPATTALYLRLALRQFYRQTDRKHPAMTVEVPGSDPQGPVFLAIVSNTDPWTYLGSRAVHANPQAGFDTGLDLLGFGSLSSARVFTAIGRMLRAKGAPLRGRRLLTLHDCKTITVRSTRPAALQIDGEYVGEQESVTFRSLPRALRVVA